MTEQYFPYDKLSFPYPEGGGKPRRPGQGCTVCVHQGYCPALYWFKRYVQREPDQHNGLTCQSWSTDIRSQVHTVNKYDIEENNYVTISQNIADEANPNGISGPMTGDAKNPF